MTCVVNINGFNNIFLHDTKIKKKFKIDIILKNKKNHQKHKVEVFFIKKIGQARHIDLSGLVHQHLKKNLDAWT